MRRYRRTEGRCGLENGPEKTGASRRRPVIDAIRTAARCASKEPSCESPLPLPTQLIRAGPWRSSWQLRTGQKLVGVSPYEIPSWLDGWGVMHPSVESVCPPPRIRESRGWNLCWHAPGPLALLCSFLVATDASWATVLVTSCRKSFGVCSGSLVSTNFVFFRIRTPQTSARKADVGNPGRVDAQNLERR